MKTKIMLAPPQTPLDSLSYLLRIFVTFVGALALLHSAWARAESKASGAESHKIASHQDGGLRVTRDAHGRKVQHVDFSDALIEGRARTPDGFVIQSRNPGRFQSLIELRSNFRSNIAVHAVEGNQPLAGQD